MSMEIALSVQVLDPTQLRDYLRYGLAAADTIVRLTRTQWDDLAAKGLRAFVEADELWTFFINDLWPIYNKPPKKMQAFAEGEGIIFPGEQSVREYIEENWVLKREASTSDAEEGSVALTGEVEYEVPQQVIDAAQRANLDVGVLIALLPEILTLAQSVLTWVKRRRGN